MISAKPWSLDAVARLFLGVIMTVCMGMILAGLLESFHRLTDSQREFLQTLIMIAFFQGAALVWIRVFLRQSNISWREAFGFKPRAPIAVVAAGLAVGVAVLPAAWLLQMLSELAMEWAHLKPVAQVAVEQLQSPEMSALERALFGVFAILLAPVAEEALFRGILYPALKQAGRPKLALWGTSLVFGVMHFNMGSLAPLIFLAVVLALIYDATDSLLAPIATHSMFNAANFFYLIFEKPINRLLHIP